MRGVGYQYETRDFKCRSGPQANGAPPWPAETSTEAGRPSKLQAKPFEAANRISVIVLPCETLRDEIPPETVVSKVP